MILRVATLSDLHGVASWISSPHDCERWAGWRVSFPIDREQLLQAIEFSDDNSFCLLHDGAVVAFGQIIGKKHRAHLARLIVEPSVRGRGYGRLLVQGLLQRVRQGTIDRVSLNVHASNVRAVSLYLALGFRDVPRPSDEPEWAGVRYMERSINRTRFEAAEPILRVEDMSVSLRYYVDVLGFENAPWGSDNFTRVSRDAAGIYLSEGDQGHAGTWAWIGVEDVAALHAEYVKSGATILHAPRNYPWAYEMKVQDPDGHVLRFGSEPREHIPFES